MSKSKKIIALILLLALAFLSYKIGMNYVEKAEENKMKLTIKELMEPYISSTTFSVNEDKFIFKVDTIEDISKTSNNEVRFNAIINILDSGNNNALISQSRLEYRYDILKSKISKHDNNNNSLRYQLFDRLTNGLVYFYANKVNKQASNGMGSMNKIEDIIVDKYLDIISEAECKYEYIHFTKDFSIMFETDSFLLKDQTSKMDIPVKMNYVTDSYSPIWGVKDISKINLRTDIKGSNTSKELNYSAIKEYLNKLPFKYTDSTDNDKANYYLDIESSWMNYSFKIYKDKIVVNRPSMVCEGEEYVNELLKILKVVE